MPQTLRRRVLLSVGGAAIVSALVAAASHSLTSPAPVYPTEDFSTDTAYVVTRILAGDAVEIEIAGVPEGIHLIGVNDQGARASDASQKAARGNAARLTRDLLLGEAVYLRRVPSAVRVNARSAAYVYRAPDGLFVNLELVRQGYASTDARATHPLGRLFTRYESRARSSARGLWGADVHDATAGATTPPHTTRASTRALRVSTDPSQITVYITKTGTKYHKVDCRFVKRSKMPSTLVAARLNLAPCSVCDPPQ